MNEKDERLYSVGHGLRGYLPESAPALCIGPADAKEALLSDLEYLAEFYSDGTNLGDGYEEVEKENREFLEELEKDIEDVKTADVSAGWIVYSHYSSYWIEVVTPSELDIPADLTRVELVEMVETINEEAW